MKLKIVADKAVFDGKTFDVIELSGKKLPINQSKFVWWIEEYFECGFWSLCRGIGDEKIVELRFRSEGYHKEIEELKGIVWIEDEVYEDFLFSAIEL